MTSSSSPEKFSKLPELARPTRYEISLTPDFSNFTFAGDETVHVSIPHTTDHFKLHASELDIHSVAIERADGTLHTNLPITVDSKWETVTIQFPDQVPAGDAKVHLKFTGKLNDKMRGFYRSAYKDSSGTEHWLASTQFESTYARQAFPCWDEPLYKAQFDVTLVVPEERTALSNMNVLSESTSNGKKTVKYATSPIMSTYLVAFAVGDFEYLESKTKSGTIMRVYTVPGKKDLGRFGLDLATRAIDWYNEWFGIDYALPKCDLIAIPDFSMGAMENWGLVTYREVALLVDPTKSSTRQKSRVALVIAHELAHLWFGDLVTMKWWTDLWLKEGFASFMEYLFVGANYPEFKIWLHFINDELAPGFALDALRSSHPIEVEIDNPNELDEIYDSITYAKSNSVNRMLCAYLGEQTFRRGLGIYLQKFKYANATTRDLWDALSESSGQDVNALMSPWTQQMGFPVITVREEKGEDGLRTLHLSQRRFIADGSDDEKAFLWPVPINISTAGEPMHIKEKILLKEREMTIQLKDIPQGDWIKLNAGTTGFYRIEYSDAMLQALLVDIKTRKLPVEDRYGISNDLFALVEAGRVSATQFLALLAASVNEEEYVVWGTLDSGISALANVLSRSSDPDLRARFDAFIVKTLKPVAERLGWEAKADEDSQTSMLRGLILGRMGKCGDKQTIEEAKARFAQYVENGTELHADLRLTVFGIVGRNSGKQGVDQLIKVYETVGFSEVERNCLLALGQAGEHDMLKFVFNYGLHEGKVRAQDVMLLFFGTRTSAIGQDFIWPLFKDHMPKLLEKFGSANSSLFQHCFKLAADSHCSEELAADVEAFFRNRERVTEETAKTLDRTIRQVTESIRLNAALLKRNGEDVSAWLKKQGF